MGALEVLFSALSSPDDAEVIVALDLLEEQGRARLIPALILYHPSRDVAFRALSILANSGRVDFVPIADRLLDSPDAELRAAALRARSAVQPEEAVLRRAVEDPSPLVRATGIVGLVAGGWGSADARRSIDDLVKSSSVETQVAFARAIERQPRGFEDVILQLAASDDYEVLRHVAHAMGTIKSPSFLPELLQMLGQREVRNEARAALIQHGDIALRQLDEALADRSLPPHVRRHIPRTISRFPPDRAAPVLQKHLLEESDGVVRFKILRALGRIAAEHPDVALDEGLLREATARTIDAVVDLLHWRVSLVRGAEEAPQRATAGHSLIVMFLRDKERHAVERIFRLLGLIFRHEDLRSIHRGLTNADSNVRAGSRELLEDLLDPPLRELVLGLVNDVADAHRLAELRPDLADASVDYESLLALLHQARQPLRSLAAYHAGELGLTVDARGEAESTEAGRLRLTDPRSDPRPDNEGMRKPMDTDSTLSIFEKILHLSRSQTQQGVECPLGRPVVSRRRSDAGAFVQGRQRDPARRRATGRGVFVGERRRSGVAAWPSPGSGGTRGHPWIRRRSSHETPWGSARLRRPTCSPWSSTERHSLDIFDDHFRVSARCDQGVRRAVISMSSGGMKQLPERSHAIHR